MCALTVAPPLSPDSSNDPSWAVRPARLRIRRPSEDHVLSLSFRDMRVNANDVTTVGEAFARCSPEELLEAVMRHEAGWRIPVDAVGSRAHHRLMSRIAAALDAMRSLEDAAVSLMPSREGVIGPLFRFASAQEGRGLEHRVEAVLFLMDDASAIEACLGVGMKRVCTWDALRTLRCDIPDSPDMKRLAPENLHGSLAILAQMPWERILALPLWLPADLSADEHQALLAKVFWSMTYCGFTQREMKQSPSSVSLKDTARSSIRSSSDPWPTDSVTAVLDHNCWIDTLEVWKCLFAIISSSETHL